MERLLIGRDIALGDWLAERTPDVAVLLAARSALRAFPLLYGVMQGEGDETRATVVLPTLRCLSLAWVAGRYARLDREQRQLAARVSSGGSRASNKIAKYAGVSAVSAAVYAAEAVHGTDQTLHGAVEKAARAAIAAAKDVAGAAAAEEMREALVEDGAAIERDRRPHRFESMGLWRGAAPVWIGQRWIGMSQTLIRYREDWDVWLDWYQSRLIGEPAQAEIELARLRVPEALWEEGPAAVNAEIRRLEEEMIGDQRAGPRASAPAAMRAVTVGRVIASRPREVALSAAVEHERIARLIEERRASLPNDPDRLEEVREEISHLEGLLPDLDAVSDGAAALPDQPTPAEAEPVARQVLSLGDRVEEYVGWVVGPERSPAVVNTALIGGLFAFLTLCGMPPSFAAPMVIASITGPKVWERIKGMLGRG